jgi:hypothetical protein
MLNIYSLYKKQHEKQKIRISVYEKVLLKCHKRIKFVADSGKQKTYFIVPEYMFGIPLYNQIACVCYLIIKLRKNGFKVKYTHPNFIYISWNHYNDEAQYNYTLNIPQIEYNSPYTNSITYNDDDFEIKRLPTNVLKKKNINHYKNLNDKLTSDINKNFKFDNLNIPHTQNKSNNISSNNNLSITQSTRSTHSTPSTSQIDTSNIVFKPKHTKNTNNQTPKKYNNDLAQHMDVLAQLNKTSKFISN